MGARSVVQCVTIIGAITIKQFVLNSEALGCNKNISKMNKIVISARACAEANWLSYLQFSGAILQLHI